MLNNLKAELQDMGKYVVQQSRSNLSKDGKGKGELYNSIEYKEDETEEGYSIEWIMDQYGAFVDQGVRGKDPSKVSPNAKITGQQAAKSPYRFGSGNYSGTWNSFQGKIKAWAKQKNIRLRKYKTVKGKRVSTGQFETGNYNSIAYIISKNIFNRGIAPSLFFTKAFDNALKRYPPLLLEAMVEDIIELTKQENGKN
tara:strand:+ start:262 stop:852 length:591 start_codon:yes stop_codon:yes gene_type:complete